ncbi:hypothetical protein [Thalassotalea mangrovi]|uniref:Uncharacterized protein n=1 Tax=Thalassotalea mangrovi TaxID=2572245 RepID=A0A4U1B742_9GAMM|nr:hypothetical protein [Thalassotalea mangrovi]TKB46019.1 hypothetical protein E8M12_05155 [Thalassotalea mangrovi]
MKTLAIALLSTSLVLAQTAKAEQALSVTEQVTMPMQTYTVTYQGNVDTLAQKTMHALQHLDYQAQLDIYQQAHYTIQNIGEQTRHFNNQLAQNQSWPATDNAAE